MNNDYLTHEEHMIDARILFDEGNAINDPSTLFEETCLEIATNESLRKSMAKKQSIDNTYVQDAEQFNDNPLGQSFLLISEPYHFNDDLTIEKSEHPIFFQKAAIQMVAKKTKHIPLHESLYKCSEKTAGRLVRINPYQTVIHRAPRNG